MVATKDAGSKTGSDVISTARRRRVPCFVIVDASGEIVLRPSDVRDGADERFPAEIIRRLIAELDDTCQTESYALTLPTVVLRAAPLTTSPLFGSGRYYAVSLEYVEARDLLNSASERFGLSSREIDVLRHVLRGFSTAETASSLCIATTTVNAHVKNIARKTNSSKRTEILAKLMGVR